MPKKKIAPPSMRNDFRDVITEGGKIPMGHETSDALADHLFDVIGQVLKEHGIPTGASESYTPNNPELAH